jgi:hypothetical protein
MNKLKATPFILMVGLIHLFCMIALIGSRISCDRTNSECIGNISRVIEAVLSFPLFTIARLFGLNGAIGGLYFLLVLFNSFLAAVALWFIVRPFVRRVERR